MLARIVQGKYRTGSGAKTILHQPGDVLEISEGTFAALRDIFERAGNGDDRAEPGESIPVNEEAGHGVGYTAKHRGFGNWDVYDMDGKLVAKRVKKAELAEKYGIVRGEDAIVSQFKKQID